MSVHTHLGMISCVESTNAAGHRLCQGSLIISFALVFQQAAQFHNLCWDNAIGGIATEEFIGIARAPHGSLVVQSWLQGKFHTCLELVLMVFTHLHNITSKFMAHNSRMLCYILMYTLVFSAQNGAFVGGHTDAIRYHLYQDFIISNLRQFKLLQTEIVSTVKSYSLCFHNKFLLNHK